jgi:predicted extracellular nuclease
MSTTRFKLSTGSFVQDWSNPGLITADDDWGNVPSIVGYRGDELTSATGTDPRTLTAPDALLMVDVVANQSATNPTGGGVYEIQGLANPTIALNGSGTADAPYLALYLDATGVENVRFQANIRDLDPSADNAIQRIAVQWRVGGGAWQNFAGDAGYIADATDPNAATRVTAIDVALPAAAANAADLEIRVITTNAVGNDELVGIDDIVVSSTPIAVDTTAPELAAANPTDPDDGAVGVAAGANIVLRFTEVVKAGTGSFTLSNGTDTRVFDVTGPEVAISGNIVTIDPAEDLVGRTIYSLVAPAGILEDAAGNDFAGLAAGVLDFAIVPTDPVTIGEIQGLSHTSPYVNARLKTEGVVTAIDSNGFYIQSAAGASDGDVRTSDGIFVFTGTAPTGIAQGDLLRITATVSEFRPGNDNRNLTVTQLSSPEIAKLGAATIEPIVIGAGGLLPPTNVIDNDAFALYDPAQDGIDFWESLEGMYVTVAAPRVIANTNSFGETYVVASDGVGATGNNARGGLTISSTDVNPERIQLDEDSGLFNGFDSIFSQGDRLADVEGVISYAFQSYELLVTEAVAVTEDVTLPKDVTRLHESAVHLSVATYNLENLSANDSPEKVASLANDIVANLRAPDILAVQEIQDADGAGTAAGLSGIPSAQVLIEAIVAAGGPRYAYAEIAPTANNATGGEPNANIRNGFLYDPSRVSLVEGSLQLIDDPIFTGTRRPLAGTFEFNDETVTLVNVHLTSRLGSDPLWGAIQPPSDSGDAARTAQSLAVRNWIDGKLAIDPGAKIAVLGDFNGFSWEGAVTALTNGGKLQDLNTLLAPEERYSYVFDGNAQAIDHIVATGNLVSVAKFDAVHINAEQPEALQLSSDHDPQLALFRLGRPGLAPELGMDDRFVPPAGFGRGGGAHGNAFVEHFAFA